MFVRFRLRDRRRYHDRQKARPLRRLALMHVARITESRKAIGTGFSQPFKQRPDQFAIDRFNRLHLGRDVRSIGNLVRQLHMHIGKIFFLRSSNATAA